MDNNLYENEANSVEGTKVKKSWNGKVQKINSRKN